MFHYIPFFCSFERLNIYLFYSFGLPTAKHHYCRLYVKGSLFSKMLRNNKIIAEVDVPRIIVG